MKGKIKMTINSTLILKNDVNINAGLVIWECINCIIEKNGMDNK